MGTKKEKKDNKKGIRLLPRVIVCVIALVAIYVGYVFFQMSQNENDIFEGVESKVEASLTEYVVYGTHLNIKGNLNIDNSNIRNVSLAFKTKNDKENEQIVSLIYNKTANGVEFHTSDLINEGIDLEELNINTHYLFIKVEYPEDVVKYYTIKNDTKYEDIYYYTITKNQKNNKVDIKFAMHKTEGKNLNYMYISVVNERLPKDVYDIVIDPGHGRNR